MKKLLIIVSLFLAYENIFSAAAAQNDSARSSQSSVQRRYLIHKPAEVVRKPITFGSGNWLYRLGKSADILANTIPTVLFASVAFKYGLENGLKYALPLPMAQLFYFIKKRIYEPLVEHLEPELRNNNTIDFNGKKLIYQASRAVPYEHNPNHIKTLYRRTFYGKFTDRGRRYAEADDKNSKEYNKRANTNYAEVFSWIPESEYNRARGTEYGKTKTPEDYGNAKGYTDTPEIDWTSADNDFLLNYRGFSTLENLILKLRGDGRYKLGGRPFLVKD